MDKKIIKTAAILGFIAIAFGAFGAHSLKKMVGVLELNTFETGVRYQMYHALFLLFVGTTNLISESAKKVIYLTTLSGILLFSGSNTCKDLYFGHLAINSSEVKPSKQPTSRNVSPSSLRFKISSKYCFSISNLNSFK
jgi:uncharacterized membrane protein YgdD (TMEM256/DUF423 family)